MMLKLWETVRQHVDLRRLTAWSAFAIGVGGFAWYARIVIGDHSMEESYGEIFHPGVVIELVLAALIAMAVTTAGYVGVLKIGDPLPMTGQYQRPKTKPVKKPKG